MTTSLMWVYPWDLVDEGINDALDRMQSLANISAINVATVYHAGKFLLPHNPARKLYIPRSSAYYYDASSTVCSSSVPSQVKTGYGRREFWSPLREECSRRGLELGAWVIALHHDDPTAADSSFVVQNAFGEPLPTNLCANNSVVRSHMVNLLDDIAATLPVDRIVIESLEWLTLRHGDHHEAFGVRMAPTTEWLLSLCFCPDCVSAMGLSSSDAHRLTSEIRKVVRESLLRGDQTWSRVSADHWEANSHALGEAFADVQRCRTEALQTLLVDVVRTIRSRTAAKVGLVDFGPLYRCGLWEGAWENGVDLRRQAAVVDEMHPTFYFTEVTSYEPKVADYCTALGGVATMIPVLRVLPPETQSMAALSAAVDALLGRAPIVGTYNYGLMSIEALAWVGGALASPQKRSAR
jgi:hypothetical protein